MSRTWQDSASLGRTDGHKPGFWRKSLAAARKLGEKPGFFGINA